MQNFLNKVGKTAAEVAGKAGNKAGELMEIGKLKGKISSKKQNAELAKKEIGEYCFELFEKNELEDEKIKEICCRIRDFELEIEELEAMIIAAKEEYNTKTEKDPVVE